MSDWMEFLGASEAKSTLAILRVGDDVRLAAKVDFIASARGSRVLTDLAELDQADVIIGPATPPFAFELGRLAQRTGGALVKCRDVWFDADSGEIVCRTTAYGGLLACDVIPASPAFVLLGFA